MNKKVILGILISIVLVYLSVRGIKFQDILNDLEKIQVKLRSFFYPPCCPDAMASFLSLGRYIAAPGKN